MIALLIHVVTARVVIAINMLCHGSLQLENVGHLHYEPSPTAATYCAALKLCCTFGGFGSPHCRSSGGFGVSKIRLPS
jgi:hypothetical protein